MLNQKVNTEQGLELRKVRGTWRVVFLGIDKGGAVLEAVARKAHSVVVPKGSFRKEATSSKFRSLDPDLTRRLDIPGTSKYRRPALLDSPLRAGMTNVEAARLILLGSGNPLDFCNV
jgi:hypothetical protein